MCFSIPLFKRGSETHETKACTFPLNEITIKSPDTQKYGIKMCNSSDFWFVSNILHFPSIICVDKLLDRHYTASSPI